MKLHVHQGPLPITPPYLELDGDFELEVILEDEEEIDLTDLFERPKPDRVILPN
jgi:hypothetical protein